jgi:HD-like signal output (HDOD) protein
MQRAEETGNFRGPAFDFVRKLAAELSGGQLELPSSPEVVVRVRKALADDNVSVQRLARLIGAEPAFAARILHLASSVAFNPDGRAVTDLNRAILRMGFNNVRSAAMAFAATQLRDAARLKHARERLTEIWRESTLVAAVCYFLARKHPHLNADEAMLAGLMHSVGKLYILGRADGHPDLFDDPATVAYVMRDWHASIGKAILDAWGFSEQVVQAVGEQDDIHRAIAGRTDLTDILIVGVLAATYAGHPDALELNMHGVPAFTRLGLDGPSCQKIMDESQREIADLRRALGG